MVPLVSTLSCKFQNKMGYVLKDSQGWAPVSLSHSYTLVLWANWFKSLCIGSQPFPHKTQSQHLGRKTFPVVNLDNDQTKSVGEITLEPYRWAYILPRPPPSSQMCEWLSQLWTLIDRTIHHPVHRLRCDATILELNPVV